LFVLSHMVVRSLHHDTIARHLYVRIFVHNLLLDFIVCCMFFLFCFFYVAVAGSYVN